MQFIPTELPGVVLIEPKVWKDDRGFFLETWHKDKWADAGIDVTFVQENHSKSNAGILRGLHTQLEHTQGKLVRVLSGAIYDVAVDIRVGSPHFGRFVAMTLSAEDFRQLWVPPHFAHGFCVLGDSAEVEYKCTDIYHPPSELTIAWDDPAIGIPWPLTNPVLSPKDTDAPTLAQLKDRLPRYE